MVALPLPSIAHRKPQRNGTHDVRPCASDESCHVPHHPAINDALNALQAEVEAGDLAAFDEATATGADEPMQEQRQRLVSLGGEPEASARRQG